MSFILSPLRELAVLQACAWRTMAAMASAGIGPAVSRAMKHNQKRTGERVPLRAVNALSRYGGCVRRTVVSSVLSPLRELAVLQASAWRTMAAMARESIGPAVRRAIKRNQKRTGERAVRCQCIEQVVYAFSSTPSLLRPRLRPACLS